MPRTISPGQQAFWRPAWLGPFLIAAIGHAALLSTLLAPLTHAAGTPAAPPPAVARASAGDPLEPLDPSCTGDALLAAAAAEVECQTPFAAGDCRAAVADQLRADLARCRGDDQPVEFAMLDPAQIERLTPIDPEPLLAITPEAQAAFEQQQEAQQLVLADEAERQKRALPEDVQVVETARPAVEITPDHARFVSEYNTKVERETVARGAVAEKMIEKPASPALPTSPDAPDPTSPKPPMDQPDGVRGAPDAPGRLSMRAPGALAPSEIAQDAHTRGAADGKDGPAGAGVGVRKGDGAIDQARRDPSEQPAGQGGGGGGAPRVPQLHPTDEQLARTVGGGSVDHYDDVDEGDVTAVNSRQWVGADFMNRTKRLVAQEWNPAQVWNRFDPDGRVYGFKNRVTVLRVTLAPDGTLVKTMVIKGSGVDVLDDEAVRAFRAAGPFPNPPDVLKGDDGMISFSFGFYFEINGARSSWKIFRQ